MASVRYAVDLGLANAGGAPTFAGANCHFLRLDTLAPITAPTLYEISDGKYYFDYDFATQAPVGVDSIDWKIVFNGVEDSGVINGVPSSGTPAPGPSVPAWPGFAGAGEIIGRTAVRCGILSLNSAQAAAYDPFAATDQNVNLLLELLRSVGDDLAGKIKTGLLKQATITTAASAQYYPVASDLQEMVDQSGWNGSVPLAGPVSTQRVAFLQAWTSAATIRIPFQLQGKNIYFPVAPADGLTITYWYVSNLWVRSASSIWGDKSAPTVASDAVLFDPELMILALRLRWREIKGFDTTTDLAAFKEAFEMAKGQDTGGPVLSLSGPHGMAGFFMNEWNMPAVPWGVP
jgi:hypothetical protein